MKFTARWTSTLYPGVVQRSHIAGGLPSVDLGSNNLIPRALSVASQTEGDESELAEDKLSNLEPTKLWISNEWKA